MADPKKQAGGDPCTQQASSVDLGSRATWRAFGHALIDALLGDDEAPAPAQTTAPQEETHVSDSDHPDDRTEPGVIDVTLEE